MEKIKTLFNTVKRSLIYIIMYMVAILVFCPCLLTFTEKDGNISILNFIGIAYSYLLYLVFKKLIWK